MKVIPYGRQSITPEDIESVVTVLKSDFLTQGPQVELFERKIADFVGCSYAVAVTNGTAALHLAALALNIRPGDKVITTPNTFVASANCVRYCGADVEFVDIDPNNFCLDLDLLEKKLRSVPAGTYAGVIPVSFAGFPFDMERLYTLSKRYKFWIIEDACHALGAERKDSAGISYHSGSCQYSEMAVFSFHPVKHIATGEGGMVTTNNKELYDRLKLLRTHGITKDPKDLGQNDGWFYEMKTLGYNYRISDILCALGVSQLARINENLLKRKEIAKRYRAHLKNIQCPDVSEQINHAYHLYVIQCDRRKELYDYLRSQGVYCQVHYIPVPDHPYYKGLYGNMELPRMRQYYERALSLPMYHSLTQNEQDYVIQKVNDFYS